MSRYNFDISSFFNNSTSANAFGSFNFGDYTSIKNGSYKKLLKSYYAEQKKPVSSDKNVADKSTSEAVKKQQKADATGLSQMKKSADSLKEATDALADEELWKQTDGNYDMDKITNAVKSFATKYNDTLAQASKVNSKDVAQDVKYMNSMTATMSKSLAKIGITVGTDGKLSVNEDELKKANVSSVKSMFKNVASYGSEISGKASAISRDAVMGSSIYGSNGALSSSLNGMFNKWI